MHTRIKRIYCCALLVVGLFTPSFAQLVINEVMSSNDAVIDDGNAEFEDWIEIYNTSGSTINVAGYYISDNPLDPLKWQIPNTNLSATSISANGHLLLWIDDDQSQGPTHSNFKLDSSGEWIGIMSFNGVTSTIVDSFAIPELQSDYSYGREVDGGSSFVKFSTSTPGSLNSNGTKQVEDVIFSKIGGEYSSSVSVSLSTATSGANIRYTFDGSDPTSSSSIYSGALPVSDINTLRAKAFKSGWTPSLTSSESYLIGVSHSLAIVTISTKPENLWDDQIGIYVEGTNGIKGNCSSTPKNWNQPWERPANIQFYDEQGQQGFNIDAGLSVSGGCSRRRDQKGMNIETKSIYPSMKISYQLFPNRDQHEFKRFKLRNGDYSQTMLKDPVTHRFVEGEVDVDLQSTRPAVVYLNDVYWGIMNIRDVHSQHSINYKHPKVEKDSINLMSPQLWSPVYASDFPVKYGQSDDILNLYYFVENNDISSSSNYDYIKQKVDISEYINYHIVQLFVANTDWPSKNFRIWHEQNGKARWMLLDTDFGLGNHRNSTNPRTKNTPDKDMMSFATDATLTGWPNDHAGTLFLRKFVTNTEFKNEFLQRYATQLSTIFLPNRTTQLVDDLADQLQPEVAQSYARWNLNGGNLSTFISTVNGVKDWLHARPSHVYNNLVNFFNLNGTYNLTINTSSNSHGRVLLNENEYLAPHNYIGKYFGGIPLVLTAVANPGYRFSHWEETANTDARITVTYTSNKTLTPVFVPETDLVINEIYYNPSGSSEAEEFIEIYNPGPAVRNIGSYTFTDGICFDFPTNTMIEGGEYIILANDASKYSGNGYDVYQWDQTELNNDGERIVLENGAGQIVDSLTYNDNLPWVSTADNGFYSLALKDPGLDNSLGTNWDVQSSFITPGELNLFLQNSTSHAYSGLVINEIHYNPYDSIVSPGDTIKGTNYEFVEIKNISNSIIYLDSVSFTRGITYSFPIGSSIAPGSFKVVADDSLRFILRYGFPPHGEYSGKLSDKGELIWLADGNGLLDAVDYETNFPWNPIPNFGYYSLACIDATVDNDSPINWKDQSVKVTPNAENQFVGNTAPNYNGLVINEIHYKPSGGEQLEFVELYNSSNALMFLTDVSFNLGISYTFPDKFPLPAGAHVVLAEDEEAYQSHYGLTSSGKFSGALSDVGETLRLVDLFKNVIDEVSYSSTLPWDPVPATGSHSLALIHAQQDNNIASNWYRQKLSHTASVQNSFADSDGDGISDHQDQCPGLNDALIGLACNDGDLCTINDTYTNCMCIGTPKPDTDNDGICDTEDNCPYDANPSQADINNNGLGDACDCNAANIGASCNDGNRCTEGEALNAFCVCTGGVYQDNDFDGVCDADDECPGANDGLVGLPCSDGDPCTSGESYDSNCQCNGGIFLDEDADGVCNAFDICPNSDDTVDNNNNGIPDGCDVCVNIIVDFDNSIIIRDTSAQLAIHTNGTVIAGSIIKYHAGESVNLSNGFEVKQGAVFHAYIAPCAN